MMRCLSSFLDFCYLVRRANIDESSLQQIQERVNSFHHYLQVFITVDVREDFNLPRLHSIVHYPLLIKEFGAPNGLCSTITESRHITAVKRPWRRSNRWNALSQMLLTNQRIDKLLALRADLVTRGLVIPLHSTVPDRFEAETDDVDALDSDEVLPSDVFLARTHERSYPRYLDVLADHIEEPTLPTLTRRFLHSQISQDPVRSDNDLPSIDSRIYVYHSAIATFYAPSDLSGTRGMLRERIRSTPSWRGDARRDCVLVVTDESKPGFRGMSAARVLLLFSFKYDNINYPCALVHWYNAFGRRPEPNTGTWIVRPAFRGSRPTSPLLAVIHLDTILRAAHLIPVYGRTSIPPKLHFSLSLDLFTAFYVSKYADHHTNEILSS
ncbi:hypothetical protein D9758_000924 [Tetrapyrgos nigripes]|uniref:Uncharacterized protein n=1 Tax=Tetrapyrgos nigripes TaxID=182062 RepID=A0A8H5GYP8_9AGAR|nr:hypothetical protein D9758_000924 [Tetrapyrgos nigripes]